MRFATRVLDNWTTKMLKRVTPDRVRRLTLWVMFLVLVAGACAITYLVGTRMLGKLEVASKLDSLQAAGYPMTYEQAYLEYAPPDGEVNAADFFIEGYKHFPFTPRETQYPACLALIGDYTPCAGEQLPAEVENVSAAFLAQSNELLALLEQIDNADSAAFPLYFEDGFEMELPHLWGVRTSLRLLRLKALLNANHGEYTVVEEQLKHVLICSRVTRREPVTISQVLMLDGTVQFIHALQDYLCRVAPSPGFLQFIQEKTSAADWRYMLRNICADKVLSFHRMIEVMETKMIETREQSRYEHGNQKLTSLVAGSYLPEIAGFEIGYAKYLHALAQCHQLTLAPHAHFLDDLDVLNKYVRDNLADDRIMKVLCENFNNDIAAAMFMGAATAVLQTVCAVELFNLQMGYLPRGADDIVPSFLASLPIDPYSGKAVRYRASPNGYLVYSIGRNRRDDNGSNDRDDFGAAEQGDSVFRVEREGLFSNRANVKPLAPVLSTVSRPDS